MPDLIKTTIIRAKAHPVVAILLILTTILVGLANTGTALETVTALWKKWTQPTPALDTTWQGVWRGSDGHVFSFVMRLAILPNDSATGQIRWRLLQVPPGSTDQNRVNDEAIEFVSGTYNRDVRIVEVQGYNVSDPTLITIDVYKLQVLNDNVSFEAMTKDVRGSWDARAKGSVILVPQRN